MSAIHRQPNKYDYCIIGGGIVGAAIAWAIRQAEPHATMLLLEKEQTAAAHQTGRNSGVIHSGIYYKPGSLKAALCKQGVADTKAFCRSHDVPFRTTGKLIVATRDEEISRLENLFANGRKNGVESTLIDASQIRKLEPYVSGLAAIKVEESAIVDYSAITRAIHDELRATGCEIRFGTEVDRILEEGNRVSVIAGTTIWSARKVVACAGLMADRLATRSGLKADFRMIPFRGDYFRLSDKWASRVSQLIYPVPDPQLPFLGVHLTPMIDGTITVGPNAALATSREGYSKLSFSPRDVASFIAWSGFWKLMSRHWRSAINELESTLSESTYLELCRRYVPTLEREDLKPFRPGIRAQAVTASGEMVDDFRFLRTENSLHVVNAPSPAATSALPIGRYIANELVGGFHAEQ